MCIICSVRAHTSFAHDDVAAKICGRYIKKTKKKKRRKTHEMIRKHSHLNHDNGL